MLAFLAGLIGYLVGDHDYTDPGSGAIPSEIHQNDPLLRVSVPTLRLRRWHVGGVHSFHEGWNELHPIKVCTPVGIWNGAWPADIPNIAKRYDHGFADANDPATIGR